MHSFVGSVTCTAFSPHLVPLLYWSWFRGKSTASLMTLFTNGLVSVKSVGWSRFHGLHRCNPHRLSLSGFADYKYHGSTLIFSISPASPSSSPPPPPSLKHLSDDHHDARTDSCCNDLSLRLLSSKQLVPHNTYSKSYILSLWPSTLCSPYSLLGDCWTQRTHQV